MKLVMLQKKLGMGVLGVLSTPYPALMTDNGFYCKFPADRAVAIARALKAAVQGDSTKEIECGNEHYSVVVRRNPPEYSSPFHLAVKGTFNVIRKGWSLKMTETEALAVIRLLLSFSKTPYFKSFSKPSLVAARMERQLAAETEIDRDLKEQRKLLKRSMLRPGQMAK